MYARDKNKQTKQRQIRTTNVPLERKKKLLLNYIYIYLFFL